jgi:predicted amidophosphoribosyltransferase
MADVLADFIFEQTPLLRSADVLVPIPAAPRKFAARGFAPNDIVAKRLSMRLALPVYDVLRRVDGIDTRDATDAELSRQFVADKARPVDLRGYSVVLIEDIWTRGRTIPICAARLRALGAETVSAVALARTRGW